MSPDIIAVGCPFCNTMMTDSVKNLNKEQSFKLMDVAELIAQASRFINQLNRSTKNDRDENNRKYITGTRGRIRRI